MSTLEIRVAKHPRLPVVAQLSAFIDALIDVMAEAQALARAANARYPFME